LDGGRSDPSGQEELIEQEDDFSISFQALLPIPVP
jgi:hypothetical protein